MSEKPIPFSAPMVRAILNSSKTQTRRVVRPQPDTRPGMNCTRLIFKDRKGAPLLDEALEAPEPVYRSLCPYGQPGDRLWVREAWRVFAAFNKKPPRDITRNELVWYEAQDEVPFHPTAFGRLRPSMFMPRWASRITLEVTGVRVERLQAISVSDAIAEGVNVHVDHHGKPRDSIYSPVQAYRDLWEQINGPGSWGANPWVWVVEFRRLPTNQRERAHGIEDVKR